MKLFFREHRGGIYSVGPYYLAKCLIESWIYLTYPALIVTVSYFAVGLVPTFGQFVTTIFIMILIANAAASAGYLIAAAVPISALSSAIATIANQILSVFGGLFLSTL